MAQYPIHDQLLMQLLQCVSEPQEFGSLLPLNHPNVSFQQFIHTELLNVHEIACSEWPTVTVETIAINCTLNGPTWKEDANCKGSWCVLWMI